MPKFQGFPFNPVRQDKFAKIFERIIRSPGPLLPHPEYIIDMPDKEIGLNRPGIVAFRPPPDIRLAESLPQFVFDRFGT